MIVSNRVLLPKYNCGLGGDRSSSTTIRDILAIDLNPGHNLMGT
ncbi:MAG: hypothetical protein O4808_05245 [Trichodesmium sp. St17_bin3_1_1]|nr:hypothetical protein [Trichodesmium sp. St17_bin3_1_1]